MLASKQGQDAETASIADKKANLKAEKAEKAKSNSEKEDSVSPDDNSSSSKDTDISEKSKAEVSVKSNGESDDPQKKPTPEDNRVEASMCPYSQWTGRQPSDMDHLIQAGKSKFEDEWHKQECPKGAEVNDHNLSLLGKGNTLGLVLGSLKIGKEEDHSLNQLEDYARKGLFKKAGEYPALIRFSDLGPDGCPQLGHFTRMAVKIEHKDANGGEQDFFTTETLESFPLGNYDDVRAFMGTKSRSVWQNIQLAASGAKGLAEATVPRGVEKTIITGGSHIPRDPRKWELPSKPDLEGEWMSGNVPTKNFFGQLPYGLGDGGAFKYKFTALQSTPWSINDSSPYNNRRSLKEWLGGSEAKFQLEIQVRDDPRSQFVTQEQHLAWPEKWIPVGVLTLAQQTVNPTTGLGEELMSVLLKNNPEITDKSLEEPWVAKSIPFHPMFALADHYPLGEVQQFRAKAYKELGGQRLGLLQQYPHRNEEPKYYSVPWAKLSESDLTKQMLTSSLDSSAWLKFDMPPLFEKLDPYTKTILKVLPADVYNSLQNPMQASQIDAFKMNPVVSKEVFTAKFGSVEINLIKHDQFKSLNTDGPAEFFKNGLLKILGDGHLFPIDDRPVHATVEEAKVIMTKVGTLQTFPVPDNEWPGGLESDEALTRLFFYSIGGVDIAERSQCAIKADPSLGRYFADYSNLKDAKVRPGFERYGVEVYFDADQKPVAIRDSFSKVITRPGDTNWEVMKFRVRQTMAMKVTGINHLLYVHFTCANDVCTNMTLHLPQGHIMQRFLTPHTFRTSVVNMGAIQALAFENGLFHRQTALEFPSQAQYFEDSYRNSNIWQPYPEIPHGEGLKKLSAEDKFPVHKHGVMFYKVCENYVTEWLDKAYATDDELMYDREFKNFYDGVVHTTGDQAYHLPTAYTRANVTSMLTTFLFTVTGYHEVVGSVGEFFTTIHGLGFRAEIDATHNDMQSYALGSTLLSSTSLRTPELMNKFDRWFGQGEGARKWEVGVWSNFQLELEELDIKLKKINELKLKYRYNTLNPSLLECAVSV